MNYIEFRKSNTNIDHESDSNIWIDFQHHEIHEGDSYLAAYSALKNSAETIELFFRTANSTKIVHAEIDAIAALGATVEIWEGTSKTDATANRITGFNKSRNSTKTSTLTISHTPGGAQAGAATFGPIYFGGANAGGVGSTGGAASTRAEIMLKVDTAYLVRVTSRANSNALTVYLDYYEHTTSLP